MSEPAARSFYSPAGNRRYGLYIAAGDGYIVFGIREPNGQGEVLGVNSREEFAELVKLLSNAAQRAWPTEEMK